MDSSQSPAESPPLTWLPGPDFEPSLSRRRKKNKRPWYKKKSGKLAIVLGIAALVAGGTTALFSYFPEWFQPFTLLSLWEMKGTPVDWFLVSWPLLLWGVLFNCGRSFFTDISRTIADKWDSKKKHFMRANMGIWSLFPFLEEIVHRWLLLLLLMPTLVALDFITFGFIQYSHYNFLAPLCDAVSFGYLADWLYHPVWAVGAAIIVSNLLFSAQHLYQGWFGAINSLIIGFFFFWCTFTYGLLSAIAIHSVYNLLLYTTIYIIYYKNFNADPPKPEIEAYWSIDTLEQWGIAEVTEDGNFVFKHPSPEHSSEIAPFSEPKSEENSPNEQ